MLRAYIVDDEKPCADELAWLLRKYPDIEVTGAFGDGAGALEAMENRRPDAVFLDIDMPGMNGMELALRVQSQHPGVIIVFVTAYAQYALESFKAFPLDFLLKPVKEARLDATVEHLRGQYALLHPAGVPDCGIRIRCFGSFEITGAHIKWGTRRVKELFLYLIDRCGASPSRNEMQRALFGEQSDRNTANNLYMTIYRLRSLLGVLDRDRKYIKMAEDCGLTAVPGVCDFTDFMAFARDNAVVTGKNAAEAARALNLCRGPYLQNEGFEWAVHSARETEREYERIALGLAGCHAAAGRVPEAENVLNTLLARNPLSAEGYAALLELHMRSGDGAAFAQRYEQYARMLRRELRVRPPARYRDHYESIRCPSEDR